MDIDMQDLPELVVNTVTTDHKLGLWFNTASFWTYIATTYAAVDAMTYTCRLDHHVCCIRRMIVGNMDCYNPEIDKNRLRFCPKLHAKLYIGYARSSLSAKPVAAYVGSLNYVNPTMHDLMVRITDKPRVTELAEYFSAFWAACDAKQSW